MIKTASALSLALLLCACGGGSKAGPSETAPIGEATAPAADEAAPAADGERAKAAEPAPTDTGAPPAGGGEAVTMTEEEWEEAVVFSEKLAAVVDANKDNCDDMAEGVKTLFDESEALIAKANQWQQTASQEDQKRFEDKYKDRLQAMGAKLGGGLQKCGTHDGVLAQFQRFQ